MRGAAVAWSYPPVGGTDGGAGYETFSLDELSLAARNHAMPLEALRYDITPVGLHYVLIHYDIPAIDPVTWRLEVGGLVGKRLSLSLEEIRAMPAVTQVVTMECAGNGRALTHPRPRSQPWIDGAVGTARWTGVPLTHVLDRADVEPGAIEVVFSAWDRGFEASEPQNYERSLSLGEASADHVLLAYEMNGEPLPPQHGYPLRLIVPGWYGMASVKWLHRIRIVSEPFDGHQQANAYRFRESDDDPGVPVTLMRPRALMVPPGVPGFLPRSRYLRPGPTILEGRAWSGGHAVARVEVSVDGGKTWMEASVDPPEDPFAWWTWSAKWEATPGEHVLCCRATDASGATQPLDPAWNVGGYANNSVQRVRVLVQAR